MAKKKVLTVITVFTDGTISVIEPDKVALSADDTNDPPPPGDGIETPPKGPGNP